MISFLVQYAHSEALFGVGHAHLGPQPVVPGAWRPRTPKPRARARACRFRCAPTARASRRSATRRRQADCVSIIFYPSSPVVVLQAERRVRGEKPRQFLRAFDSLSCSHITSRAVVETRARRATHARQRRRPYPCTASLRHAGRSERRCSARCPAPTPAKIRSDRRSRWSVVEQGIQLERARRTGSPPSSELTSGARRGSRARVVAVGGLGARVRRDEGPERRRALAPAALRKPLGHEAEGERSVPAPTSVRARA